jgi:hypothetical protein
VLEANERARVLRKSVFFKCPQWFAREAAPFKEHVVVARKLSPSPFVRALLTPGRIRCRIRAASGAVRVLRFSRPRIGSNAVTRNKIGRLI